MVFNHSPHARGHDSEWIDIETTELAGLLHLLDRWSNVLDIATGILRHLEGATFVAPVLRPDSPIQGMQEMLDEERITEEEINAFLRGVAE